MGAAVSTSYEPHRHLWARRNTAAEIVAAVGVGVHTQGGELHRDTRPFSQAVDTLALLSMKVKGDFKNYTALVAGLQGKWYNLVEHTA